MEKIEWRDVPGWEGKYQVSSDGAVRSVDRILKTKVCRGRIRRLRKAVGGKYTMVGLWDTGRQETRYVHDLVMISFVGPKPEGLEVCHYDDDGTNNRLSNLRYDTHQANGLDRYRNRRHVYRTRAEKTAYMREWRRRARHVTAI